MFIGFSQLPDKLVFERSLELSLRDQSADWSWQSPNNSEWFVRAFVRFSYNPEDPGDCHVAALLAMTAFFSAANSQFLCLLILLSFRILLTCFCAVPHRRKLQAIDGLLIVGWGKPQVPVDLHRVG